MRLPIATYHVQVANVTHVHLAVHIVELIHTPIALHCPNTCLHNVVQSTSQSTQQIEYIPISLANTHIIDLLGLTTTQAPRKEPARSQLME
jgi:hypothetical protein